MKFAGAMSFSSVWDLEHRGTAAGSACNTSGARSVICFTILRQDDLFPIRDHFLLSDIRGFKDQLAHQAARLSRHSCRGLALPVAFFAAVKLGQPCCRMSQLAS